MRELLHQIYYSTSANLSIGECVMQIALGLLAWLNHKDKRWAPDSLQRIPDSSHYALASCAGVK